MEEPFHLQYEKQVVLEHASKYKQSTWHNHLIPEDVYHASGYINDWNKHRLERIIRNNKKKNKSLILGDYGIDFISYDPVDKTYHAGQAKCYENARVTAKDCVTFTNTVFIHMRTTGYLYTSKNKLEAYLRENIQASRGLLVHEVLPLDDKYRSSPQGNFQRGTSPHGTFQRETSPQGNFQRETSPHGTFPQGNFQREISHETTYALRPYQEEAIQAVLRSGEQKTLLKLITGSGKTLIASHILRNSTFKIIVCVAPLRCSVEQLHERISPFLPDHASILVDTDGCTDISQLKTMLEGAQWAIFTTFASFVDIIPKLLSASCFLAENTFLLIDEVHNAVNNVTLCELANAFKHSLYLSATVPEELAENLDFDEVFSYNIRTAIEEGVCVDYEVFVPYIENFEFENEPTRVAADLRTKAMYLATGILRTGKRRCIVYLSNIQESLAFEREIVSVFDEYHGITIDTFQMNCNTAKTERQAMLHAFGSSSHYDRIRIIANVRILNEAVDIVPCDSVFISKVGDSTNDITTVQRLGRALRKDIHNPCKVAALFLWCDDYNDTLKSLQLLKQEDIEFHSKVRLLNGCYDNTSKDRASVEEKEKKFTRFVEVKCLTLDEMWETRRQRWICEYEKKGKTPSEKSKDPDEKRAGQWQANMRQKYKNNTLPPDLLALIEATDGWEWEQVDPFEANLEKWVCEYEKKGKTPSEKSKDPEEKSAGIWQSHMRQNYRKGILTAERIAKLELNEGWKWNSHNPFEHYLEQWIVEYEKKRKTPSATSKDPEEKRAGQWQSQMRFAYKAQKLTTERIAKLEENEGWEWEQDDPFEANLENWTREFSKKRKTPSGHSKDAEEKRAGNWQNQMRHKYKNGRLLPERVAKLEAKEGWKWSK